MVVACEGRAMTVMKSCKVASFPPHVRNLNSAGYCASVLGARRDEVPKRSVDGVVKTEYILSSP